MAPEKTEAESLPGRLSSTAPSAAADYALSLAAVAAATALCRLMDPLFAPANLVMVYLLATLLVAARGRRGPAVLASALGVLSFDFFFVPPRYSFAVADAQYVLTFLVMFAVAVVISHLALRLRSEAEAARQGGRRTATMHALSRELAVTRGRAAIIAVGLRHAAAAFGGRVEALVPGSGGGLERFGGGPELDEKERGVAKWVFEHGHLAGRGADTLPLAPALFVSLAGTQGPEGVLRMESGASMGVEQRLLLEAFAHQIALALEVDRLQDRAREAQMEAEKERLRSSLLSSVSHDLRTPLAAILGSATSLLQSPSAGGPKTRELLENIQSESERMSRLVQNLIETTRLESGVSLSKEPCSLEELVGAALERVGKLLVGRELKTALPEDLPLVALDSVLMEQVFVNLLENAARHTPATAPIEVSAKLEGDAVLFEVADRGPGLRPDELERIFEKFYHARSPAAGAGLGLAICRAVVNAHGGRIWAENRSGGGALFRLSLPLEADHG